METDWTALRACVQAAPADLHRRVFFDALLRRGEAAQAAQPAVARHCRDRVEAFLQHTAGTSTAPAVAEPGVTSPLEGLKSRWEEASRRRAVALLDRLGRHLTPAERAAYTTRVAEAPAPALAPLRRHLQDRLLRILARRRAGNREVTGSVEIEAGAGPYNARATLAAVWNRVVAADAEWLREWVALYARMQKTLRTFGALRPEG